MTNRSIYPTDLAAAFADRAGKRYLPSNGLEGELFYEAWCSDCARDAAHRADPALGDGCPILAASMAYAFADKGYPIAWQYGLDGQPRCTAFTIEGLPERCDRTPDLFDDAPAAV